MTQNNNISDLTQIDINLLGLIQYKRSPRYVDLKDIDWELLKGTKIKPVAVFVNNPIEEIREVLLNTPITTIQLHGKESPSMCKALQNLGYTVIKALGVDSEFEWLECEKYIDNIDFFLFDTKSIQHGGTGVKFNWDLLHSYPYSTPFFLSGGISNDDLSTLKNNIHPYMIGVDVNSRFEVSPGVKEINDINTFVNHLRDLNNVKMV
ncbi:phosphoribosylanthranilate isomerase [Halosquirtibacter xylanolyticus]|uniref:phosphoribosylanthranilate isomerase n=1 Tax=Halosquirtibacter xylanolyticus TaxID=3374599 RepID=UPI003749A89D|nr:phosphoribosylanthranilate isomerase [Prolixibacteraceae bacterium]